MMPLQLDNDLTEAGRLCLSKALLEHLAETCGPSAWVPDNGLGLYASYFETFALTEADAGLSALRRFRNGKLKVARTFYACSKPRREPRYFSLWSHHDLCRLSSLVGREIVLFLKEPKTGVLQLFHDFRGLPGIGPGSGSQLEPAEPAFFVVARPGRLYEIGRSDAERILGGAPPGFARDGEFAGGSADLLASLELCLPSGWSSGADFTQPRPLLRDYADVALACSGGELFRRWNRRALIVCYARSKAKLASRGAVGCHSPDNAVFFTLGFVGPDGEHLDATVSGPGAPELDGVPVLCLYSGAGGFACLLDEPHARKVVRRHFDTAGTKESLANRRRAALPKVTSQRRESAWQKVKAKRRRPARSRPRTCRCRICRSAAYSDNMAPHGPQQQITVEHTLTDLLRMLGLDSPQVRESLERMRALSVAAMDIESVTRDLDLGPPGPGPAVGYADVEAGGGFLESHPRKSQRPVMVAHVDLLGLEGGDGTQVFTAVGDDEEHCFGLLSRYWEHVLASHRRAADSKARLARPLLELIDEYRGAFIDHSVRWVLRDRESRKLWLREEAGRMISLFPLLAGLRLTGQEPSPSTSASGDLLELVCASESPGARDQLARRLRAAGGSPEEVAEFMHLVESAHSSSSWNGRGASAASEDLWTGPDHRSLQAAWNQSLPGKLEAQLRRLIRSYTVFTFYG